MRAFCSSFLLCLLWLSGGCASDRDASSPVGMVYQAGTLVAVEEVPMEKVFAACLDGAKAADLITNESNRNQQSGHIYAMARDFKTVVFKLQRLTPTKTELRIRVGSFGDREQTMNIYEQVQESLKAMQ